MNWLDSGDLPETSGGEETVAMQDTVVAARDIGTSPDDLWAVEAKKPKDENGDPRPDRHGPRGSNSDAAYPL